MTHIDSNSVAGSLLSAILFMVTMVGVESGVKIMAGIMTCFASGITIYYTIKKNKKQ